MSSTQRLLGGVSYKIYSTIGSGFALENRRRQSPRMLDAEDISTSDRDSGPIQMIENARQEIFSLASS